ncbi:geranylgeranyl reductase family protein [Actinocorallia libanotica]|uniref:Geranylgeranyl reductase family protein n=1 Tax=Actinocorallia libanotica TaxID=46162 RepID=A0ABN1RVN5_9ACTN
MSTTRAGGGEVWDVVVVGAGPAGAGAARVAAETGCRVLLLERFAIPRYKACGGGLIGFSQAALPDGVPITVHDEIDSITFGQSGRRLRTFRSRKGPLCKMVFRDELDAALTEAAADAGAMVRDGTALKVVREEDGLVSAWTDTGELVRARSLVGADGSASRVARYVGVSCEQVDLALEIEAPVVPEVASEWRGRMLIDWGPLPGSFGWVFPKGDICTAGVVAARGQGAATRAYMDAFLDRYGLTREGAVHDTGHLTRCRHAHSPLAKGRVLVAGDAAGLCDPWSREGISFALRSGAWAGRAAAEIAEAGDAAVVRRVCSDYTQTVISVLGAEMAASRQLMNLLTKHPDLFHTVLTRIPPVWHMAESYLTGEASIPALMRRPVARMALKTANLL